MSGRILRRWVAALTALATLAAPLAWPLAALAGQGKRTLLVPICTTQGTAASSEIVVPGPSPADRNRSHACHACVLCAAGGDRPAAGPSPARIEVPACTATAEVPEAPCPAGPASGPARIPRARGPPSLA